MFSNFAKALLVFTSLAPILLTLAFVNFIQGSFLPWGCAYLMMTVLLVTICLAMLRFARRTLERIPVKVTAIKPADKEIVGFLLAYLLPLVNTSNVAKVDIKVLAFVLTILFAVVWSTNAYHFNPLLGFFRYHFYEATTEERVTYVLVSRQNIRAAAAVTLVVHVTEYMLLETSEANL